MFRTSIVLTPRFIVSAISSVVFSCNSSEKCVMPSHTSYLQSQVARYKIALSVVTIVVTYEISRGRSENVSKS